MTTARRAYLYIVAGISLAVLAFGAIQLCDALLSTIGVALGPGLLVGDGSTDRGRFSLAAALMIVGLPLFLIHWGLAQRGTRGDDPRAEDERQSSIRALLIAIVQTVAMVAAAFGAVALIRWGIGLPLGADPVDQVSDDVAVSVVALPIWAYFSWVRNGDLRRTHLVGAAAWLPRLYRYGAALAGVVAVMFGASALIATTSRMVVGTADFGSDLDWWRVPLAGAAATLLVGALVWWVHWRDARRLIVDAASVGEDERDTRLRSTYFGALLLTTVAVVAFDVASVLAELGRWILGIADRGGTMAFLETVIGPMIAVIPFVMGAWLSVRVHQREAAGRWQGSLASAERLALHVIAFIGLTFLAFGTAQLLGLAIESLLGATGDRYVGEQVVWHVAQAIVGVALWIPAWSALLRRRRAAGIQEQGSITARAYLYLVVGASLIVCVPSAAYVLYQAIDTMLGGAAADLSATIAAPLGVVIVAGIIAAYHVRILRQDLRSSPVPGSSSTSIDRPSVEMARGVTVDAIDLVLQGPAGTDLGAVASALRLHLPAGITLDVRSVDRALPARPMSQSS